MRSSATLALNRMWREEEEAGRREEPKEPEDFVVRMARSKVRRRGTGLQKVGPDMIGPMIFGRAK